MASSLLVVTILAFLLDTCYTHPPLQVERQNADVMVFLSSPTPSSSTSATASVTPSPTSSLSPSRSPTPSITPSVSPTPSITPALSRTPTLSPSSAILSAENSVTPSPTRFTWPVISPTLSPTPSQSPTMSPSLSSSQSASMKPSVSPTKANTFSIPPSPSSSTSATPSASYILAAIPPMMKKSSPSPSSSFYVLPSPSSSKPTSPSLSATPSASYILAAIPIMTQSPSSSPPYSASSYPGSLTSAKPSVPVSISVSISATPSTSASQSSSSVLSVIFPVIVLESPTTMYIVKNTSAMSPKPSGSKSVSSNQSSSNACFPAIAAVELRNGTIMQMSHLSLGEEVRVGTKEFSRVIMFTHRTEMGTFRFLEFQLQNGETTSMSEGHFMYVNGEMKAASDAKVGDYLERSINGAHVRIVGIKHTNAHGLFNPHTHHGDIVVDGYRASTYTATIPYSASHALLGVFRLMDRCIGVRTRMLETAAEMLSMLNRSVKASVEYVISVSKSQ